MIRFGPRSLGGQMILLLGLALLAAQLVNFALILNERQRYALLQNQGPALNRFAGVVADYAAAPAEFRPYILADASRRGARFRTIERLDMLVRDAALEARARRALAEAGVTRGAVVASSIGAQPGRAGAALRLAWRQGRGSWLLARIAVPRAERGLGLRLGLATFLVFAIVLGVAAVIALRIARPLSDLTRAAERFGGREVPDMVAPRGPDDLRRAIEAFNAMNMRVAALLDEKDRMLGAIGHDLRTPLASLRIRLEAMEPEDEREAAVATLERTAAMLEEILVLARTGRAREQARPTDLAALAREVAEEARGLGGRVALDAPAALVARVSPGLIRRAIANLIDNAVRHGGGGGRLTVRETGGEAEISVSDDGPGIPAKAIDRVLRPFERLDTSRNSASGGSGLGLAIVKSIVESHGGTLALTSGETGGLTVTMRLPRD
jgi:signal transduction histidine kinase